MQHVLQLDRFFTLCAMEESVEAMLRRGELFVGRHSLVSDEVGFVAAAYTASSAGPYILP